TLRITMSASRTADAFSSPVHEVTAGSALARAAASSARPWSREPITIGTPADPSLTARPNPSAPVPPTMHTVEVTARQCKVPPPMGDSLEVGIEDATEFEVGGGLLTDV